MRREYYPANLLHGGRDYEAFVFSVGEFGGVDRSAAAADLSRPAPQQYYKAAVAPPVYNWTGFYIGINGGGGFGRSAWDTTGGFNNSGGLVGGTLGYNYQVGQAVFGVEGDIDWANINGTTTSACPLGCKTGDDWLGTVRGRLGYAADRFMPFITGGAAFGDIKTSTPGFAGATQTNVGWTVGAGLEFAIAQNCHRPIWIRVGMGCELRQQIVHGFLDRPIVRRIVANAEITFRFACMMRCVEEFMCAQQTNEMGTQKGGVARLRCFAQRMSLKLQAD